MLDKVKLALRKTAAVFNDEVTDYINSACADLRLVRKWDRPIQRAIPF